MSSLRFTGPIILTALLIATLSLPTHAQNSLIASANPGGIVTILPNAPTPAPTQQTDPQSGGIIFGTVLDAEGADISDAVVTLENTSSGADRTITTDNSGSFKFDAVEPGQFTLTVTSTGFESWTQTGLALQSGQIYQIPAVELKIAAAVSSVQVTYTRHDLAEDQMHFEEKQRVLGIFPNFYASYIWNAAPLSAGQKFRLALRTSIDPVSIAIPVIIAGTEQSQDNFNGYGQGTQGFAKRFGASYTDSVTSTFFGGAILPSLLHQDPRYFYKGVGSISSRALYAISTVVICKGDNGRWEPNYSNVFGNLASASLSNAYYPANNRGAQLTIDNWLIGTASGAIGALFQEFLVKKISRGIHSDPGVESLLELSKSPHTSH
jgi:Carboxypeptidase regulatory-like domain